MSWASTRKPANFFVRRKSQVRYLGYRHSFVGIKGLDQNKEGHEKPATSNASRDGKYATDEDDDEPNGIQRKVWAEKALMNAAVGIAEASFNLSSN